MQRSTRTQAAHLSPTGWLKQGWHLVRKDWQESLCVGCVFAMLTCLCLSLALQWNVFFLIPALMVLTLIAPLFAFYCYHKAALNLHFKMRGLVFFFYIKENTMNAGFISCLLISLLLFWLQLEIILLVFIPESHVNIINMAPLLTLGTLIGALMSGMFFCVTAFSPQLIMKGQHDAIDAIFMSLSVVKAYPKAMLIWFVLISLIMLFSLMTLGLGFILFMPLMSYSSWYAYQDVFENSYA
jgi:uncharacterized membrane protein